MATGEEEAKVPILDSIERYDYWNRDYPWLNIVNIRGVTPCIDANAVQTAKDQIMFLGGYCHDDMSKSYVHKFKVDESTGDLFNFKKIKMDVDNPITLASRRPQLLQDGRIIFSNDAKNEIYTHTINDEDGKFEIEELLTDFTEDV